MSTFEILLDEIESRAPRVRFSQPHIDPLLQFQRNESTTAGAAAAYLCCAQGEPPPPPRIDELHAQFLREIENARGSIPRLAKLRRKIAWSLHPDRCATDGDESQAAMARLNALLDAALVAKKKNFTAPR
ncbi:MAG: hypothetical protein N2444_09360 [Methylocystis sp.]|nr:hypothetical protein [Methylocystis sp.]